MTTGNYSGHSLIELLVVTAVLGIGVLLGLPGFGSALSRGRVQDAVSALTVGIAQARTTAIMRGVRAQLCPNSDGETCVPGTHWERGWLLFADTDEDQARDTSEPVILVAGPFATGVIARSTAGRPLVAFQPDGRSWGSNVTFVVCAPANRESAQMVVINNSGRMRTERSAAARAACVD